MSTQISSNKSRRSARSKVMLAATLDYGGGCARVRVLDLSSQGALVAGEEIPAVDTDVTLQCGTQSVAGSIAWVRGQKAGVEFRKSVNRHLFAPTRDPANHIVVEDARKLHFRRPGFRGNQLTVEERYFLDQLLNDHAIATAA